jgi:hypothetical protein
MCKIVVQPGIQIEVGVGTIWSFVCIKVQEGKVAIYPSSHGELNVGMFAIEVVKEIILFSWSMRPTSFIIHFTLKTEAAWSPEMMVSHHHITMQCHNPEDRDLSISMVCWSFMFNFLLSPTFNSEFFEG